MNRKIQNSKLYNLAPFIPPGCFLGLGLYYLTDGAPISWRINALFTRAILRDEPITLTDWFHWHATGHSPWNSQDTAQFLRLLPSRVIALDIWREDEFGSFNFSGAYWRKSHSDLGETWIPSCQESSFVPGVGMIGTVAAQKEWDFKKRLGENGTFLRQRAAQSSEISYGRACVVKVEGESFVIGIYSKSEPFLSEGCLVPIINHSSK